MKRYEDEFKLMIIQKNKEGQSVTSLAKEFNVGVSTIHKWINMYNNTQSFKEADQLTDEQKEIATLKKELKQKDMELDILKQAALIMGQKR